MTTGRWKFEDGQWQGPLWPIKGLYYAVVTLAIGTLAVIAATSVVALWMSLT